MGNVLGILSGQAVIGGNLASIVITTGGNFTSPYQAAITPNWNTKIASIVYSPTQITVTFDTASPALGGIVSWIVAAPGASNAWTPVTPASVQPFLDGQIAIPQDTGQGGFVVNFTPAINASYEVFVTPNWDTTVKVLAKNNTSFTVAFGTPAPALSSIDWRIESP